jgi:hypothetical protein
MKIFLVAVTVVILFGVFPAPCLAVPPIDPIVKQCVVYVEIQLCDQNGNLLFNEQGKPVTRLNGTGFLVGVRDPRERDKNKADKLFGKAYLVTAGHVVKDQNGYLPKIWLRLNKLNQEAAEIELTLKPSGPGRNVFTHPQDDLADLVVIPLMPAQLAGYDFVVISDAMVMTQEQFRKEEIREGIDIFFTGWFGGYAGEKRNYPIVRFGKVALISDEKIPWKENEIIQHLDLYLVEAMAWPGNSGSPAFFHLGAERRPGGIVVGGTSVWLAGVVKGNWYCSEERKVKPVDQNIQIPDLKVEVSGHSGISAVIPAYKLHDILFGDELKNIRGY